MKEYNHKTRRWEEKKEKIGSLKKPETCKGKQPHDFVLLIPSMISRHRPFSKEDILRYYELEADREERESVYNAELAKIGIDSLRYSYKLRKFYTCSKCGKEKYE